MSYSPLLNILSIAVKKVAHNIIRDFNELEFLQKNLPSAQNYMAQSIERIENSLYKDLGQFRNRYSFILNTHGKIENTDTSNYFVINGIVGKKNFLRGIPNFAVSIGVKRDDLPYAGVIYNPLINELFLAEDKIGTYFNSRKIRIDANSSENISLIATDTKAFQEINSKYDIQISNAPIMDLCYLVAHKIDLCYYKQTFNYNNLIAALALVNTANFHTTFSLDKDTNLVTDLQCSRSLLNNDIFLS